MQVVKDAISVVCRNIDSEAYTWDEKKPAGEGWSRFGVKVIGNRKLIDVGLKSEPEDNNKVAETVVV